MTTKKNETEVPEYLVERLAAGDLSPGRATDVRRRLALEVGDAGGHGGDGGPAERRGLQRLEQITASNTTILASHPPSVVAHEIRRRAAAASDSEGEKAGALRWGLALGLPGALAASLALALWLRSGPSATGTAADRATASPTAAVDSERIKGLQPSLRVYRKHAGKIERLKEGAPAHAGDELQVAYVAAGHRFGVVASVDGAGHITYHLPAKGVSAVALRPDGEVALPEAYELDAAPGFERFVFVVGDAPFHTDAVTAIIERGAGTSPAGTVAASFTVRKE